jgi:transcriptional regulator with XRE-family HTH domain
MSNKPDIWEISTGNVQNIRYFCAVMDLLDVANAIRARRRELRMTQAELAKQASLGCSTLNALENGKLPELGTMRLLNVLEVLGLTLTVTRMPDRRPTLDDRYAEQAEAARRERDMAARPRFRG